MENLVAIVTLLVALSVASERLVDIVKNPCPWLREQQKGNAEGWRKAVLQLLAVGAGILTAFLARPAILNVVPEAWQGKPELSILALGLLASGGSGVWNTVLSYLLKVRDIRKAALDEKKLDFADKKEKFIKDWGKDPLV